MPLKLNVGLSRKVGDTNYGSRGASVNVEMELESSLVGEPSKLQDRIRQLFGVVRSSLAEELNGSQQVSKNGNGTAPDKSNGSTSNRRAATQSQVKAIHAIANKKQLNLGQLLRERFHVGRADDLSLQEASRLIDELKKEG